MHYYKNFLVRIPHTGEWSKLSHGDDSTSSYFLDPRLSFFFFFFQLIKILPVTDLVENFKSEKVYNKISVSERLRSGMYLCDENEPKRKKIKNFST